MTDNSALNSPECGSRPNRFATTHWSLVLAAGRASSPEGDRALETLCQTYWYPLYAFARRRGHCQEDASDLTQEFFARLLEKEFLQAVNPERGRFRAFLITVFKRFLGQQHERAQAAKRGGGTTSLSLDVTDGERRYRVEPVDHWSAEKLFERRWALTLLETVLGRLQGEYQAKGQAELFYACRQWLVGEQITTSYAEVSARLAMSEGTVRVAVSRMRDRYRELLRSEVAATVCDQSGLDSEIRRLRAALRGQ